MTNTFRQGKIPKIKAGVLGSTGIVGQQFVRMLNGHPWFETVALAASPAAAGRRYDDAVDWMLSGGCPSPAGRILLCRPTGSDLRESGVRIVFSALPASVAGELEEDLSGSGFRVFTNAGAHRMRPGVPVVIPEVNPDHLGLISGREPGEGGYIVANANCSTTGLALALKPLDSFGIRSLQVATYQALSGAGRSGLPALRAFDNVIPLIPGEEDKMSRETNRILGRLEGGSITPAGIEITATCCRVPVRDGHLEAVTAELEGDADLTRLKRAFHDFTALPQRLRLPSAPRRPLIMRRESDRPQPALDRLAGTPRAARGMAVSIGRLSLRGRRLRFVLLVHNTIRGAAGTCLLNAEMAAARGLLDEGPSESFRKEEPCGS